MAKAVKKLVKKSTFGLLDLDPNMPEPPEPETAPDADSEESTKASMRAAQRRRRTGRLSTVLSSNNTLG